MVNDELWYPEGCLYNLEDATMNSDFTGQPLGDVGDARKLKIYIIIKTPLLGISDLVKGIFDFFT